MPWPLCTRRFVEVPRRKAVGEQESYLSVGGQVATLPWHRWFAKHREELFAVMPQLELTQICELPT